MKHFIIIILLALLPLAAKAGWITNYVSGYPVSSELKVYRSGSNTTFKYIYNYLDSTFRVQVYPEAAYLAAVQNWANRRPARPAYIEVFFRFKGDNGKETLKYYVSNPNPDINKMVGNGYFETIVKDDGRILQHMRNSKKMELRYFDFGEWGYRALELDTTDFEKHTAER